MGKMNKNRLQKIIPISALAIILLILPLMIRDFPFTLHLIIMAGIFTIGVLGVLTDLGFRAVERWLFGWNVQLRG